LQQPACSTDIRGVLVGAVTKGTPRNLPEIALPPPLRHKRFGQMNASLSRRLKFRFIAVTCEEAFFDKVKQGVADAARQLDVDWDFTGTRGTDVAEMVALARQALAQGYDGLAIDMFELNSR
jgi:ABC-type sugar transport system substrate-binding protein